MRCHRSVGFVLSSLLSCLVHKDQATSNHQHHLLFVFLWKTLQNADLTALRGAFEFELLVCRGLSSQASPASQKEALKVLEARVQAASQAGGCSKALEAAKDKIVVLECGSQESPASQKAALKVLEARVLAALRKGGCSKDLKALGDQIVALGCGSQASPASQKEALKVREARVQAASRKGGCSKALEAAKGKIVDLGCGSLASAAS